MKFSDLFILSTRMFKARTSRTLLTILGMSVGIGAIIFLVSLGYGLQNTLLERITTSDSLLTLDVTPNRSSGTILNLGVLEEIKKMDGVAEISPSYQLNSQGKMEDLTVDMSAVAVDSNYLKFDGMKLAQGRLINDDEPWGIIVSTSIAQVFGKTAEEIIGKEMSFIFSLPNLTEGEEENRETATTEKTEKLIPEEPFKIIGVVESDSSSVYVNVSALKDIQISEFAQIKVKCANSDVMNQIRGRLEEKGFLVSSLSETIDQANKIFAIIRTILMLFGIIALVVSAIGMFNTMTITLLERTEEIGIMKSIGASDAVISLMFVMESAIMGFLGGLAGIMIGWVEGYVFNLIVNLIASHFGGEKVDLFYSPLWFVAAVVAFSAVVGLLTGVVPARRASKIDPLDALRYK